MTWRGDDLYLPGADVADDGVNYVGRPITNGLAELRRVDTEARLILSRVSDVRIAQFDGPLPYAVRLLFMIEGVDASRQATVLGLASIVAKMGTWMDHNAQIVAWDAADLSELSASDYLNTVPLYAEHLSEQGDDGEDRVPHQFGYEDFS